MFEDFIKKLKERFPTSENVVIVILEEYDSIEAPDGTMGFGAYDPQEKVIYVAGDIPEPEVTVPRIIAHEYAHFLQDVEGKEFDEDLAEKFADMVYQELI